MNGLWTIGIVNWHPQLAPWLSGLLIAALSWWGYVLYTRMRTRMSARNAAVVLAPKVVILALLCIALFDPSKTMTRRAKGERHVLLVLDGSSSMDVADGDGTSRRIRAMRAADQIESSLPDGITARRLDFDTELRDHNPDATDNADGPIRGTDLGACLLGLAERPDLSACAAAVVLTDGGDEAVPDAPLPGVPLHLVGMGTNPSRWRDLAVAEVHCPPTVEKEIGFEVRVDLQARTQGRTSMDRFSDVGVALEREEGGEWLGVAEARVDLANGRAQTIFRTACDTAGLHHYRVRVDRSPGEVSYLNNARTFRVDAQKKSLHVLFYTEELGAALKLIRSELASDPGITFTALFRTIGDRFTVQGERLPGDEALEAGFPTNQQVLAMFDCTIVGSFPAAEWEDSQMRALADYVEGGGAVIFLGGEQSFNRGGYADTPLAPLFPFLLTGPAAEMAVGTFPVGIPPSAADHPIVSGVAELLTEAATSGGATGVTRPPAVRSLNLPGRLKPGATVLMHAAVGQRSAPLISVHAFGKGRALAIHSNTLWKWARESAALRSAFGLIWRQAARNLSRSRDGGRVLTLEWDKESYRPGETATATLRVTGQLDVPALHLTANLANGDEIRPLPVLPQEGQAGVFEVRMTFGRRGMYRFTLAAHRDEALLETYEKMLPVSPHLSEGAKLEVDTRFLAALAKRGSGRFVQEADLAELVEDLEQRDLRRTVVTDVSLIHGNSVFLWLFLGVLVIEWTIRRRMNLF